MSSLNLLLHNIVQSPLGPRLTGAHSELNPSITTLCSLLLNQCAIHWYTLPLIYLVVWFHQVIHGEEGYQTLSGSQEKLHPVIWLCQTEKRLLWKVQQDFLFRKPCCETLVKRLSRWLTILSYNALELLTYHLSLTNGPAIAWYFLFPFLKNQCFVCYFPIRTDDALSQRHIKYSCERREYFVFRVFRI